MCAEKKISDSEIYNITRTEELAYELTIAEVMSWDLITISPEAPMTEALELFRIKRISGAPVIEGEKLVGVLSIEDLIRALRDQQQSKSVSAYMTKKVITVHTYDQVVEALKLFRKTHVGRLPVLDENQNLVGMLTKGDITDGFLRAIQEEVSSEEMMRYRASHLFEDINSDRSSLILRYRVKKDDFEHGGEASNKIKKALLRLGASPQIARLCGIAAYEAEMNLIIHTSRGGTLRVEIEPNKIRMEAYDSGPGIPDIEAALQPGFSTAPHEIREKGFGAGMGLVNIYNCVDEMDLVSSPEKGTNLHMIMYLDRYLSHNQESGHEAK
jgi:CBS domain-containing protein/anti-sigma regulatory factor (Ser/Thr protein kinase)